MNIEEIKLKIIKQFNTPGSALQSLMCTPKNELPYPYPYFYERNFIYSDIGLHVSVKTINDDGLFQVAFRPINEKDLKAVIKDKDLSKIETLLAETPHTFEKFNCYSNGFEIETQDCHIVEKEYDYRFSTINRTSMSIDARGNVDITPYIKNGEFLNCFDISNAVYIYHPYELTQEDIDKVMGIKWDETIPASQILRIQKAFSDALKSKHKDKTQLYSILDQLLK